MLVTTNSKDLANLAVAEIAVERAVDQTYDYEVPEGMRGRLEVGMQVVVPLGPTKVNGFVVGLKAESDFDGKLRAILRVVVDKPLIEPPILRLALWMADYYMCPLSLVLKSVLPRAVRKKGLQFREVHFVSRKALGAEMERPRLSAKQKMVLEVLEKQGDMTMSALLDQTGVTRVVVKNIEKKGLVEIETRRVQRNPHEGDTVLPSEPLKLTSEQSAALQQVCRAIDGNDGDKGVSPVTLLYGVTGSGKTEVYLQAIAYARAQGLGAIVLVPEISLTPQTVERFRARFGDAIAVLHSHLSEGERHDEWHRIHEQEANLVIGPRSALFAPVANLGLIVVDEEHETSYKQGEAPMYNARDVAVMRSRLENCAVLLGTATPAVETMHNVHLGKYGMVTLSQRADHAKMPRVKIVDMRLEQARTGKPQIFSKELMDAIHNRLQLQEQTILFLNRRGFSTQFLCPQCGYVAECDHCSVSMTYYRKRHMLQCNLCGETRKVPTVCPECKSSAIRHQGLGTEKVASYLDEWLSHARVQRVDSDSMRNKDSYQRVLHAFRSGQIDILVGTQMIAKGLHFPNVTLVGVIFADSTLHMPDFRASERTFQLLTQVAGRAGRGDTMGEVIVQTYTPHHPAVQAARALDYDRFFTEEIEFRKQMGYPPFKHLAVLTARGKKEENVIEGINAFHRMIHAMHPHPKLSIQGPMPAAVLRVKDMYRYQMIFMAPTSRMITRPIGQAFANFKWTGGVKAGFDLDALNVM